MWVLEAPGEGLRLLKEKVTGPLWPFLAQWPRGSHFRASFHPSVPLSVQGGQSLVPSIISVVGADRERQ